MTKMQKLLAMVLFGAFFVSDAVGTGCPACGGKNKQHAEDQLQQVNLQNNQFKGLNDHAGKDALTTQYYGAAQNDQAKQLGQQQMWNAADKQNLGSAYGTLGSYPMLGAAGSMDQGLQSGIGRGSMMFGAHQGADQHGAAHGGLQRDIWGGQGRRNRRNRWNGDWRRWGRWSNGGRRHHRDFDNWNIRQANIMDQNAMIDQNRMINLNALMGQNGMIDQNALMGQYNLMGQNGMIDHNMIDQNRMIDLNAFMGQNGMIDQNALMGQYNLMGQNDMIDHNMIDQNALMGLRRYGDWSGHGRRHGGRRNRRNSWSWGGRGFRQHANKGLQGRTINLEELKGAQDLNKQQQVFGANTATKIPQNIQFTQDDKAKKATTSSIQF